MKEHAPQSPAVVGLLPEFGCFLNDAQVTLPRAPGRLLIQLALVGEASRRAIAASLWPDTDPLHATKRLSQALWRIRDRTGDALLKAEADRLRLADGVSVDYWAAKAIAHNILKGISRPADPDPLVVKMLSTELLRELDDDEIDRERERWDRLRTLALERMADDLLRRGDPDKTIEIALLASEVDELAEGPQLLLASAHLTRGDTISARRVYRRYTETVRRELQVEPSAAFRELVSLGGGPSTR
ncbi:bacterial transcriptional activator domain-containing protein [Actinomadura fulvescens]|uniref:Bacterial transcriptional activator domain-containing protein n=1 Tax=Actinomadura fulvescens TaxID=46160 RepID=A0ABP6CDJ5_9ACTN